MRTKFKTAAGILISGVFVAGPLVAASPATAADTAGCVTKAEFKSVSKGMGLKRVHNILDTAGKQTYYSSGSKYYPAVQWREYKACVKPTWSSVNVDYKRKNGRWVVTNKSAYWG